MLIATAVLAALTMMASHNSEDNGWKSLVAVVRRQGSEGGPRGSGSRFDSRHGDGGVGSPGSNGSNLKKSLGDIRDSDTNNKNSDGDTNEPPSSFSRFSKVLQPHKQQQQEPKVKADEVPKKTKRWKPCGAKFEMERHDHETRHGDICRAKGGLMGMFECPTGCHDTGGPPPFCAKGDGDLRGKGGGPCRFINPDKNVMEYRCDGDACIMAYGTPKQQFKGEGKYIDETCDGECGDGRILGIIREGDAGVGGGGSYKCASDLDCSLSGVCGSDGTCRCDKWADGVDCSYLKFQPVDKMRLGYLHEIHSSWGGSVAAMTNSTGHVEEYRMFVSEIMCPDYDPKNVKKRCGLNSWQTHSRIVVASSLTIDGPYRRRNNETSALGLVPEHHNPSLIVDKSTGRWQLYTISGPAGPIERVTSVDGGTTWGTPRTVSSRQNPAPVLHSGGSTLLYYRADGMNLPSPTCSDEGIAMQVCPKDESEECSDPNDTPVLGRAAEDPSVFRDHRGNYHMLFNAHPYKCVPKTKQGGHAWSSDGIHWESPRVGAFDTTIRYTDGTKMECERRERPQMILDESGRPLALVSALTGCPRGLGGSSNPFGGDAMFYKGGDDCFTLVQKMAEVA